MKLKVQGPIQTITIDAPAGGLTAGQIVGVDAGCYIALDDAAAGEKAAVMIYGIVWLPTDSLTATAGSFVIFDVSAGRTVASAAPTGEDFAIGVFVDDGELIANSGAATGYIYPNAGYARPVLINFGV